MKAQVNDAALWTSIGLKKNVSKKLSFNIAEQIRFNENITQLGFYNTEVGMDYKLHKNLVLSPNYRYIHRRRLDHTYGVRHRLFIDLGYTLNHRKWSFILRTRLQSQYNNVITKELGKKAQNVSRNQITIKYRYNKKISPYIAQEFYYALNGSRIHQFTYSLSYIGLHYKSHKKLAFNFYYLIQAQLKTPNPKRTFATGISATYTL